MKKLITICLLLAVAFTVNAQNTGPTKEQTVQFIKDYFTNEIPLHATKIYTDKDGNFNNRRYNIDSLSVYFDKTTNILAVYYDYIDKSVIGTKAGPWNSTRCSKSKFIFDLSKIESIKIEVEILNYNGGYTSLVYLNFNAATGYEIDSYYVTKLDLYDEKKLSLKDIVLPITSKKVKSIKIPIKLYNVSDNFDHTIVNEKIYKAFNHLRKLCGAPEPISFD